MHLEYSYYFNRKLTIYLTNFLFIYVLKHLCIEKRHITKIRQYQQSIVK